MIQCRHLCPKRPSRGYIYDCLISLGWEDRKMKRVQNHFPYAALKTSSENSYLNLCIANVAKYLLSFPLSKRAESLSISVPMKRNYLFFKIINYTIIQYFSLFYVWNYPNYKGFFLRFFLEMTNEINTLSSFKWRLGTDQQFSQQV